MVKTESQHRLAEVRSWGLAVEKDEKMSRFYLLSWRFTN
jgi:hypothetical protein